MNSKQTASLRLVIALSVTVVGLFAIFLLVFSKSTSNIFASIPLWNSRQSFAMETLEFISVTVMICLSLASLMVPEKHGIEAELAEMTEKFAASNTKSSHVQQEISAQLSLTLIKLRNHLESTGTFSGVLDTAGRNLIELTSPEQLRLAIGYLIVQNNKMREETNNLQTHLTISNLQIENLRQNLVKAEELGLRDPLTTMWNRRAFEKMLGAHIEESTQNKSPLSLILVDIDHFKKVNDSFGHLIGDEVLKLVAGTISQNVKGRDLVSRFGGEEFAIILPETTLVNAKHIAQQIRQKLENQKWISRQHKQPIGIVTASFGVSEYQNGEEKTMLQQRADEKLYEAKNTGRNRVVG